MKQPSSIISLKALANQMGVVSAASLLEAQEGQDLVGSKKLPEQVLLECQCSGRSVGGQALIDIALAQNKQAHGYAALIDVANGFDIEGVEPSFGAELLWVRCIDSMQALHCMDLLLRDENFSSVIADLRGDAGNSLQNVPSSLWYRLQRLVHQRVGLSLVLTEHHCIPSADVQWVIKTPRTFSDLDKTRQQLRLELLQKLEGLSSSGQRQTAVAG